MGDVGIGDVFTGLGALGGSDETGSPSSGGSSSISGYYALPPQAQAAYNNYFNLVNSLGTMSPITAPSGGFSNYNANPQNPFTSQSLLGLQQANPGMGMNPSGFLEPFNQYQQTALQGYGNANPSDPNFLNGYTNPYNQMVQQNTIDQINRSYDMNNSNIMDDNSRLNARAVGSSLGTQLAQNQQNRARDIGSATANLGYQGYNSALDLRNSLLGQQLSAGSAIQSQNQAGLQYSNPLSYMQSQYQMNPQYAQANALGPLFGAFPQSSQSNSSQVGSSITPNSYQPTALSKVGGLGMYLFG
jgi:hypothetical protein